MPLLPTTLIQTGVPSAQLNGLNAVPAGAEETFPRTAVLGSALCPAAGILYGTLIWLDPKAYTTLTVESNAATSAMANSFWALYDSAAVPNQLAVSADVSAIWNALSAAKQNVSFTLNATVTSSGLYYLAFLCGSATTLPTLARAQFTSNSGLISLPPAIANRSTATGLTAMPSTYTPLASATVWQIWARYS